MLLVWPVSWCAAGASVLRHRTCLLTCWNKSLFQEELQNSGAHATFGGPDGMPSERDKMATYFIEAARWAELTHDCVMGIVY